MLDTRTIHILDPDLGRRASIVREMLGHGIHAEAYENLNELAARPPRSGCILVFDNDEGPAVSDISQIVGHDGSFVPVAMYCDRLNAERLVAAMLAGALDYLSWPFDAEVLNRSLDRMNGSDEAIAARRRKMATSRRLVERLSPRERDVLRALVNGASNKQMGEALGISPRTVEIHRANMMRKLNASTTSDAVRIGLFAEVDA